MAVVPPAVVSWPVLVMVTAPSKVPTAMTSCSEMVIEDPADEHA